MIATIGFFDGLHEGHRYVISQVLNLAERRGDGSMVFTFDRHPASLFCPEKAPKLLLSPEEKVEMISNLGVEDVVMFEFDHELASLTVNEFLQILKEDYGVDTLLLGYDNHFGKKELDADGKPINLSFEDYVKKGKEEGVRIKRLEKYSDSADQTATSSSLIRSLLLDGNLAEANRRLGYNYMLSGRVVSGHQIGRTIGFPTANIDVLEKLVPKNGVYAAYAKIKDDGKSCSGQSFDRLKAVVNIGKRPTFQGHETTVEVHILDFSADLYDKEICIELFSRLRDEQKFSTTEQLIGQINSDKIAALKVL